MQVTIIRFLQNLKKWKNFSFNNELGFDAENIKQINRFNIQNDLNKFINFLALEVEKNGGESKNEIIGLEIISDTKLTTADTFLAKGNVRARTNSIVLQADELEYNSKSKIIFIKGNIKFKTNDQFLLANKIKYDPKVKKGYILDAYGSINFDT